MQDTEAKKSTFKNKLTSFTTKGEHHFIIYTKHIVCSDHIRTQVVLIQTCACFTVQLPHI